MTGPDFPTLSAASLVPNLHGVRGHYERTVFLDLVDRCYGALEKAGGWQALTCDLGEALGAVAGGGMTWVGFARAPGTAPFGAEKGLLQRLLPHLTRGLNLARRITLDPEGMREGAGGQSVMCLSDALALQRQPALWLDRRGQAAGPELASAGVRPDRNRTGAGSPPGLRRAVGRVCPDPWHEASTAGWYLKNAEAKTGTSRSQQLVALAFCKGIARA